MVIKPTQYCVYHHVDSTGDVFYVGSGVAHRPFDFISRSKKWKEFVASLYEFNIEVVKWFEHPHDARAFEAEEISRLKPHTNGANERTAEMNKPRPKPQVFIHKMKCTNKLCGNTWIPRVSNPVACPKCKQYLKNN